MAAFYENFIFKLESFSYHIVSECAYVWQSKAVDVTSESFCVISKVHYFVFMVFCLYTFNLFPLSLKLMMTLVATTYKNMESRLICKTTYMMRVKGQRGNSLFLFLDWTLYCTIHISQMKLLAKWNCHGNRSRRLYQKL